MSVSIFVSAMDHGSFDGDKGVLKCGVSLSFVLFE